MNGGWLYRLDLADRGRRPRSTSPSAPTCRPGRAALGGRERQHRHRRHLARRQARGLRGARRPLHRAGQGRRHRALTATPGVRESAPAWSPDGARIAYYSDASGEMELYVAAAGRLGRGPAGDRRRGGLALPRGVEPRWQEARLRQQRPSSSRSSTSPPASGRYVDTDTQGDIDVYAWSPDSQWLAYEKSHPETRLPSLAVYSLASGAVDDSGRRADLRLRPGVQRRRPVPLLPEQSGLQPELLRLRVQLHLRRRDPGLRRVARTPTPSRSSRSRATRWPSVEGREDGRGRCGGDGRGRSGGRPLRVDADGFVARTLALPGLEAGNYGALSAVEGAVLFLSFPADGPPALMRYDLAEREAKELAAAVEGYVLAAEGREVALQLRRQLDDRGRRLG